MSLPVFRTAGINPLDPSWLEIEPALVRRWLVEFLRDEVRRQRGIARAVVGLSGGVDSAVTTYLCAEAFGPGNVYVFRLPYKLSSQASLDDAQAVIDDLGLSARTIEITRMAEGYLNIEEPEADPTRIGNVCARCRMTVLFDQSAKLSALPIGTANKTERLFGYYTWHADDAPPINPLGDLFKTQVWALARHLGVPRSIIDKPASADLVPGQSDEGDFGITYAQADAVLNARLRGFTRRSLAGIGVPSRVLDVVEARLEGTHWKRRGPTVAVLSDTAIGEYYLRPVDYR